jgi:hypothetical protein
LQQLPEPFGAVTRQGMLDVDGAAQTRDIGMAVGTFDAVGGVIRGLVAIHCALRAGFGKATLRRHWGAD